MKYLKKCDDDGSIANKITNAKNFFLHYMVVSIIFAISNAVYLILRFSTIGIDAQNKVYFVFAFIVNPILFFAAIYWIGLVLMRAEKDNLHPKSQHFGGFDIVIKIAIAIIVGLTIKYNAKETASIVLTSVVFGLFIVSIFLHVFLFKTTVTILKKIPKTYFDNLKVQ